MIVEIIRGLGDKKAEPIVNPLCVTGQVCIQKGRNFLDNNIGNIKEYRIRMKYKPVPLSGLVVKVMDSSLGQSFFGRVTGFNIRVAGMMDKAPVNIETQITVESPL